jgi:hypothetical protein
MTDLPQRFDVRARRNRSTPTAHRFTPPDTGSRLAALTRRERVLVGLELFLAVGAVAGGGGMLLDTSGRGQGLPNNLLDGTPFSSYLVPGIVLLALNAVLPTLVAVLAIRRQPIARLGHLAVALALAGWLAGETFFIGLASWMQPFFFVYAVVIGLLGVWVLREAADRSPAQAARP